MNDLPLAADPPFRILSLDGGGMRGIFSASLLAELERLTGRGMATYFDLIVGTSTGGIIGLALALGLTANAVLRLYRDRGREIFGSRRRLLALIRPKYGNERLRDALRDVFQERVLNEVVTPVCVTSYELTNSYPRIWKDDHADELTLGGETLAWRIALATSAAPTYFPAAQVLQHDSHVDGGLFANNPSLVGLTEALRYFRRRIDNIRLLSVGAGEHAARIPFTTARTMGAIQWGTGKLFDQMLIGQARVAHEVTRCMLGPDQYERLTIPLERSYPLDDYRLAATLVEPGAQTARINYARLQDMFFFEEARVGRAQQRAVRQAREAGANDRRPR